MALRGERYLRKSNEGLAKFIVDELPYLDYHETLRFYAAALPHMSVEDSALLGCNDRYYLLTGLLSRTDALHPWLFDRCREVEAQPDDHLDLWAREHYKMLPLKLPVPTPSGWQPHGDLKAGDWVFGPDGQPTRVIATTPVFTDGEAYEMTFDDGTVIRAGAEHLWSVERRTRKRVPGMYDKDVSEGQKRQYRETVVISTREIAQHGHQQDNRLAVRVNDALVMPDAILPIEPYVLGAWLGDGFSASGRICGMDDEVFREVERCGFDVTEYRGEAGKHPDYRVASIRGLGALLRGLVLIDNKHIPVFYQRASARQRLELLRGLMDTDGHCNTRGTATFVNKNERLIDSVFELALGLGLKPRKYTYDVEHGRYWQLAFQAYQELNPFRVARKAARAKAGSRPKPRRYIVSCVPIEPEPMSCIQVDRPDGLYLAGREMVTTHNSTLITYAGAIQETLIDPEITIGIFSNTKKIAEKFVVQIKEEFERNEGLKATYADVLWDNPTTQAPLWSADKGIVVKRRSNPKEPTIEACGLAQGMPTGRHFRLRIYDDVVTPESVTNEEMIKKTTEKWELSSYLAGGERRKWYIGTRYHYGDTYGVILTRNGATPRVYPATDDGKLEGKPVFLSAEKWAIQKNENRSTIAAQMLQNPLQGKEQTFQAGWLRGYELRPRTLNVYIMGDPSKGRTKTSDRTAIAVVGIDTAGNKYLLDGVRHRMQMAERWKTLKGLYQKWSRAKGVQSVSVGWERYGQQTDDEYFLEQMEREGFSFPIEELAWPREGGASKKDRVERLEPDFRNERFYLPAQVWERGGVGACLWSVDVERNKTVLRKIQQPTKTVAKAEAAGEGYLVVKPIVRKDEDGNLYDVTMALMEEMLFFPVGQHDDLVDATSRIYDLSPVRPSIHEIHAASEDEGFPDA